MPTWTARIHLQIGDVDDPPHADLELLLSALTDALIQDSRVLRVESLPANTIDPPSSNPTRNIEYDLSAATEKQASSIANDEISVEALQAAFDALPPDKQQIGWWMSTDVCEEGGEPLY